MISLAPAGFDSFIGESDRPVLIDFWAPWCGTCMLLEPVLRRLAGDYEGRVSFGAVNVEDAPDIVARYDIGTLPTVLVMRKGVVEQRLTGLKSRKQLIEILDKATT